MSKWMGSRAIIPGLAFLAAFVIRVIFWHEWAASPFGFEPYLDAQSYHQWAQAIAQGEWLREQAFYQSPLYPYLLGLLYTAFGPSVEAATWMQVILSALTVGWLTLFTQDHFGRKAAVAAGALACLYRPMVFFSAPLMKETLGLFVLTGFIYFAMRLFEHDRKRDYLWAGLFLGWSAFVRSNVLLLILPILGRAIWRPNWSKGLKTLGFTVVVMLTIAPATLHNWWVSQDFVLINSAGGFNFYIAHSPTATGANNYPPEVSTDPMREESDARRVAEQEMKRVLKPSEVSDFWMQKGWSFLVQNPEQEVSLMLNKLRSLLAASELPDNYDIGFYTKHMSQVLHAPMIGFATLLACLVLGLAFHGRDPVSVRLVLFASIFAASVLAFYVTDRYRLPLVIFMIPLAGAGVAGLAERRKWIHTLTYVLAAFLVGTISTRLSFQANRDLEVYNWGVVASLYSDAKKDAEAIKALAHAERLNPQALTAQSLIKTSTSHERLGQEREAERLLQLATQIHPRDGLTHVNLGRFYLERQQFARALASLQTAKTVAPWLYQTYIGLALIALAQGQETEARAATEAGLRLNPTSPELQQLWVRLRK